MSKGKKKLELLGMTKEFNDWVKIKKKNTFLSGSKVKLKYWDTTLSSNVKVGDIGTLGRGFIGTYPFDVDFGGKLHSISFRKEELPKYFEVVD